MAAPRLDQELLQSLNSAWSGMERTMAWQQEVIKKLMERSASLDALHKAVVDATDRISKLHTELDRVNKDRQALRIENRQLEKQLSNAVHSSDWDELSELAENAREKVLEVADLVAGSGAAATSAPALTELITRMGAVTAKLREIVDGSGGAGVATGADAGSGSEHV